MDNDDKKMKKKITESGDPSSSDSQKSVKRNFDGVLSPDEDAVFERMQRLSSTPDESSHSTSKKDKSKDYHHEDDLRSHRGFFTRLLRWILQSPPRVIVISFALVIMVSTFLLSLPIASANGRSIGFLHALFTATSATCVTGLVVADTAIQWSTFGELVIILSVQIGGLGLVTIMSFFMMAAKRKVSLKTMLAMQESTASESFVDAKTLVSRIIGITLSFELLGGAILTARYATRMSFLNALRRGMFQGISAFCNAGFDLMGDFSGPYSSLTAWHDDPVVLLTTAFLIIFGGMGFVVWNDLLTRPKRKTHLSYHTKLILKLTTILIVVGSLASALLEWQNMGELTMGQLPVGEKLIASFFQSTTLRTAGFNSINQANLTTASKFFGVIWMFIGAGPASTGGGVKVTTLAVVVAAAIANVRGQDEVILAKRRVDRSIYMRALVIMMMGIMMLVFGSFFLSIFEQHRIKAGDFDFIDIMYEVISSFATVGVTSTPTSSLTSASHIVLIICMYLGRVGPASFAMGLTLRQRGSAEQIMPEGRTYVG